MSEKECKKDFIEYLSKTFGSEFCAKISVPVNVHFGERVAYILQGDAIGKRKPISSETFKELEHLAAVMDGKIVEFNPPVESGGSKPRLVDLPGCEISFGLPAKRFLDSASITPEAGLEIQYVFGLIFGHSYKKLVLIDFTLPNIKAVFSVDYEIEEDLTNRKETVGNLLIEFVNKLNMLKCEIAQRDHEIEWIKIVQVEYDLIIRTKFKEQN